MVVVECCIIHSSKTIRTLVLVLQKIWRENIFANRPTWDITFICDPTLFKFGMAVEIKLINYLGQEVFVQIYISLDKNKRDLFYFQVYEGGIYEHKLNK